MRKIRQTMVLMCLLTLLLAVPALAQKIELAVGAGGYFPVNLTGVGNAAAIEGSVAYRVASVPLLSAYVEVPVVGTLNSSVTTLGLTSSASYSALFVAPGLRVKFAPGFFVSPWFAAGGGLAHFSANSGLRQLGGSDSTNTNVFDYGGGLDIKIAPYLSVRGEVRDFYSGGLGFSLATFNQRQHNIVTTGGLVFRF
ncbi:MAG: porin family protein [Acidobacteriia bacterium]|nr:porin family protein [Terriglobia bacterium]